MAMFVRVGLRFTRNVLTNPVRSISVSNPLALKEIRVQKEGTNVTIEAVKVPSPRTQLLVHAENTSEGPSPPCYMCALGLDVRHTDVLILSQFVRQDGCMLPKRITGLCARQQKKISKMVSMAQKAGLMINLTPAWCKKDPKKRYGHRKFNTYFDESTIFMKKIPKPVDRFKR